MRRILIATILISVFGCQKQANNSEATISDLEVSKEEVYPDLFNRFLDAHGGLDQWKSFGTLEYNIEGTLGREKEERHIIDLNSRNVLIKNDSFNIGMNGEQVWITPNKEAFGKMSPRFYHNLFFYFFSMPFVLADPGAIYEDLGKQTIDGKEYLALKVSFKEGVGDAPKDFYVAHLNPETYQLEVLLYTVTYFSGEKSQKFNSLLYKEWTEVNGLLVPAYMEGHKYEDGAIGDLRYSSRFTDISFTKESPDVALFDIPEGAVIDTLITYE